MDEAAKIKADKQAAYERAQKAFAAMRDAMDLANEQERLANAAEVGAIRKGHEARALQAREAWNTENKAFIEANSDYMRALDKLRHIPLAAVRSLLAPPASRRLLESW